MEIFFLVSRHFVTGSIKILENGKYDTRAFSIIFIALFLSNCKCLPSYFVVLPQKALRMQAIARECAGMNQKRPDMSGESLII